MTPEIFWKMYGSMLIPAIVPVILTLVLIIYLIILKRKKSRRVEEHATAEERMAMNIMKEEQPLSLLTDNKGYLALVYVKRLVRMGLSESLIKSKLRSMNWSNDYINYILGRINMEKVKKQPQEIVDVLTMKFEQELLSLVEDMDEVSMKNAADVLGISLDKINELALMIEERGLLFVEERGKERFMLSRILGEKRILDKLTDAIPHSRDYYKKTLTKLDDLGELVKEKEKIGYDEAMKTLGIDKEKMEKYVSFLEKNEFLVKETEEGRIMLVLNK